MGKGGQCRDGYWIGKAGLRGLLRELTPVRAQKNIWALFPSRAILQSGTMKGRQPNRGCCRGGQLLAKGQARNSVCQCLPWGGHEEAGREATVNHWEEAVGYEEGRTHVGW